ncbi:MAG TPA: RNA polymerase factor sigma-54 [Candidatus Sumerlaeota bacterium]|nr:RNA polymerase factor sigma-54 [Candidatus Sumerlaeota bacterium]
MPLSMQQSQKLSQRLVMTPQMQQSIKLLQMNAIELEELTQQELLENPFLELEEDGFAEEGWGAERAAGEGELGAVSSRDDSGAEGTAGEDSAGSGDYETDPHADLRSEDETASDGIESVAIEDRPEQFGELDLDWGETFSDDSDADAGRTAGGEEDWVEIFSHSGPRSFVASGDEGEERSFEETVARGTSLYEKLMWQLHVSALSGVDQEIGRYLIGCIDERGYLQTRSTVEECASRFDLPPQKVEEVLDRLEAEAPPKAGMEELNAWVEAHLEKAEQKLGLYLAGYLATEHARPGLVTIQRKPTMEACAERFGVTLNHVERILCVIQEFDPSGVGARDLPECLVLQLAGLGELDLTAKEVLMDHWEDLLRKQFRPIARALEVREEDVVAVFNKVRKLQPAPGLAYTKEQPLYITPDVYVREIDGHYVTYLNEGDVAHLRLSSTYRNILLREDVENQDPKEREYAIDKFRAAVMFIKNIEKRRNTVLRVTEAIMEYQKEFLEHGVESLRPLSLAEIADRVGMHESTISRVTSGKYVDTPQGLLELKYFFSSAIQSDDGEAASSRSIKSKIRELIDAEDSRRPLSDDKIAQQLQTAGFSIARRTVAKYREQLRILPTSMRRKSN